MRNLITLFIFFSFCTPILSQNHQITIDSTYETIFKHAYSNKDTSLIDIAIMKAEKASDSIFLGNAINRKALIFFHLAAKEIDIETQNYYRKRGAQLTKEALNVYDKLLIHLKGADRKKIIEWRTYPATNYSDKWLLKNGYSQKADSVLKVQHKLLLELESAGFYLGHDTLNHPFYQNLTSQGKLLLSTGLNKAALKIFIQAKKYLGKEEKKDRYTGWIYQNIGEVYFAEDEFLLAKKNLLKALKIKEDLVADEKNNFKAKSNDFLNALNFLGSVSLKEGNIRQAETYINKALSVNVKPNVIVQRYIESKLVESKILKEKKDGNYKTVISNLDSLILNTTTLSKIDKIVFYIELIGITSSINRNLSLKFYDEINRLSPDLDVTFMVQLANNALESKYELELRNRLMESETEQRTTFLILGGTLIGLLMFYFYRRAKSKAEAEKNKTTMLLGVYHDIKNPIGKINKEIRDIIDNIGNTKTVKNKLANIKFTANYLDDLAMTILQTNNDKSDVVYHIEKHDLHKLIEESINQTYAAESLNFEITNNIPLNVTAEFDDKLLKRVFQNLFINSIRAIKDQLNGAVNFSGKIIVQIDDESNPKEIQVIDNGGGIKKLNKNRKSTGIGLRYIETIIGIHKGVFHLENTKLDDTPGAIARIKLNNIDVNGKVSKMIIQALDEKVISPNTVEILLRNGISEIKEIPFYQFTKILKKLDMIKQNARDLDAIKVLDDLENHILNQRKYGFNSIINQIGK